MAIFKLNHSKCIICNEVLNEKDNLYSIPSLFPKSDPRVKYNDSIVHFECLQNEEEYQSIIEIISLWEDKKNSKTCCICNNIIESFDDFFMVHLPLSDKLEKKNIKLFDIFHKSCFDKINLIKYENDN